MNPPSIGSASRGARAVLAAAVATAMGCSSTEPAIGGGAGAGSSGAGLSDSGAQGSAPGAADTGALAPNDSAGAIDAPGSAVDAAIGGEDTAAPVADTGTGPGSEEGGGASQDGGDSTATTCPMLTQGWTEYHPTHVIQFEDGSYTVNPPGMDLHSPYCTYTNSGGIELFKMLKDPAGRIQRCEARVQNEYTTGSNEFEGDVRVTAGNATCVHQVFLFLMLDAFPANGGEFHEHTGPLVGTGVFGKWVHVNTIHHLASGGADIYLDCQKKLTAQARPPTGTGWYNKYGVYAVNHAPPVDMMAQSEWKNV